MNLQPDFSKRPTKITINLGNLEKNFVALKKDLSASKIMAVVKANAYGHGLIPCAERLEKCGADYFGVALVEEGELLRKSGIKAPIHVFGGILNSQVERFLASNLELTASSQSKLLAIEEIAAKAQVKAKVHLKIDTGMGRLGVRTESAKALIESCSNLKHTEVRGIFSHFACADDGDLNYTKHQYEKFCPVVEFAKKELGPQLLAHIANSAAAIQFPESALDMVRLGLSLYGVSPSRILKSTLNLEAVMSVRSQVVFFKVVKAGDSVSYGRTWTASKDTRVVTVPIGYGDGYLRALSNKASVIIRGKRYPIVGRVCMDQLMVGIGDGEAYNGDSVTLIGNDGTESIAVDELADLAGSIPHEILAMLNLRMEREFIG